MSEFKLAVVFPGQGSQYIGMGKSLLESEYSSIMEDHFQRASNVLGYDVKELCLNGPGDILSQTEKTQPTLLTVGVAYYEVLKKLGITPDVVLGHSVGEYTALTSAGFCSFEEGVKATYLRGKSMQEATPLGVGAMYAVMRVPQELVIQACQKASLDLNKEVVCANFNTTEQIVISGHEEACVAAIKNLEESFEGRTRAIKLNVSAPFHSPLMKPAVNKMRQYFEGLDLNTTEVPYIANVDAKTYASADSSIITKNLLDQICGSVQWVQSINALPSSCKIVEVGPGKVLTGLVKKINNDLRVFSFEEESDLNRVIKNLNVFLGD